MRGILLLGVAAACSAPPTAPVPRARVNLRETARAALTGDAEPPGYHGGIPDGTSPEHQAQIGDPDRVIPWRPARGLRAFGPGDATPELAHSFQGLGDDNRSVPPDTMGAVGPGHLVVTLNTQFRVQDRNGAALSTVTLDNFWQELGADAFDPRVLYDHFADRWITVAVGDARTENSAVLLGVTDGDDPEGDWTLRRYDADVEDQTWADYPALGFNQRWIAIQNNMFDFDGGFIRGDLWVLDKEDLYAGGDGNPVVLNIGNIGTLVPAVVFDPEEQDLHCVIHWSGDFQGRGWVRLYRIFGATDDPQLEDVGFGSVQTPWDFAPPDHANFAPQAGSAVRIQNNDARIHSVVQREGSIWAVHTNFIPHGAPDRAAVRFWELATDGAVRQTGLIDGQDEGRLYAFPSLAVNASRDVLIGFSQFGEDIFPGAAYAFRSNRDLAGAVREVVSLRDGEAPYAKDRGDRNRWGDYSVTAVDPLDDHTLWTLQEYAEAPSEGIDRFGVWWGAMTPPGAPPVWVSPGDPEVDEGAELAVPLLATDADDDDLQFGALVLPEGAALDLASEPVRLVWTPGFEQAGKHDVVLTVTDGGRIVRLRFEVTVVNVDRPPTLADPGDLRVRERQRLTFTLDGADPDGDRLTFTGEPLPPGATLGADTGRFTWTPSAGQSGDHPVTFTVSAGGLLAERDATIIVAGVNGPPVLTPPANVELDEGERLTVVVEAADPDGDDVRLLFDPMPVGALFDDVSRRFEWLTGFEQEGVYPIAITATDGSLSDEHIWHVTVRDVNRPPVFAAVADQHLEEGQQMLFFAEAVDPDGDEVALSAEQLPGLAQFNADTGACMWDAGFGAAGEWMVVLGASDGQELSLLRVPVTIDDVNRAPVLQPLGTVAAAEGSPVEIGIDAEDPDGDAVALAARDLPAGAQLDGEAGWILWTPTFEQAGRHLVTVQASDGDLSDETLLVLDVADTNRAPEIEVAPVLVAEEGVALVAAVRASDPDGDLVQLSAEDLPPGAQLSVDGALTWTPSFDDAGDHGIVVVASDGDLSARAPVTLRVDDVDRPPTLAPLPDLRAAEGEELVVPVEAGDPDGDALELSLVDAPQGMAVDGAALRWTPGFEQAGAHAVTVRVAAGGADAEASFTVTVADVDRPPTLEITGDPAQGREGELLELTLVGVDPDGEAVSYGASLLPSGAVLAAADGRLSWTPAFDQAGTHPAVLLALAGGAVTALNVELTVADVDRPPTVRIEGPLKGVEAAPLELRVVAEDPDGGELTVTSPGLPRGAELDGRVIRWTPDYDQAGEHRIRAVAADAAGEAEAEVTLVIDNVNRQPEVVSPDDVSGREDDAVRVALTASDPDGDELTFRAGGLPSQARLHRTLGTITWHPGFDDAGDYSVEITVSDGTLSAHGGFELSIADVNRPPEVSAPTVHHVQAGATLVFTAVASDPDGDTLTLSAVPLPPGASMDGSKGVFRWTPAAADAGQVKLTVTASDGRLTATQDVTVFVSKGGEGGCATASGSATPLAAALWPGVLWRR